MLGSYHPMDVIGKKHSLQAVKQEPQLHGLCEELSLSLLTEAVVEAGLEQPMKTVETACAEVARNEGCGAMRRRKRKERLVDRLLKQPARPPRPVQVVCEGDTKPRQRLAGSCSGGEGLSPGV